MQHFITLDTFDKRPKYITNTICQKTFYTARLHQYVCKCKNTKQTFISVSYLPCVHEDTIALTTTYT